VLFGPPGLAYVYLCYGIHRMFNVVTERDGVAAAVLVRALVPERGLEVMERRRGGKSTRDLCSGPGKLCEALGIDLHQTYEPVWQAPFAMSGRVAGSEDPEIVTGPRIGITKGAELPWRYCLAGSRYLSQPAG
jgi:DNA-3-methyladenine glycosylase